MAEGNILEGSTVTPTTTVTANQSDRSHSFRGLGSNESTLSPNDNAVPDEFQDLEVVARSADGDKHRNKLWPIPFTAVKVSIPATVPSQRYTEFIFTFPRLFAYLKANEVQDYRLDDYLRDEGRTITKRDKRGDGTWTVTRWSRVAYLRQRIVEGFTPEDVVRELKLPRFKTASSACYRWGKSMDGTAVLDRFAFGEEGLQRLCAGLCAEIEVQEVSVRRALAKKGRQSRFEGVGEDGSQVLWAIRRAG